MSLYPQTQALEGRITIFTRVISIMFMLFGIGAAIAQLAKISPFLESYPGWTWNLSKGEGIIGISFICLLGIIFWYRSHRQKQQGGYHYLTYLVPSWFLAIFFSLALVIYVILEYTDGLGFVISRDQEFAELLLSLGFLFFVIVNYFRQVFEFGLLKPSAARQK